MAEIIKEIHGGLDLDTPKDHISESKLIDAVNVSHNSDERERGVLHPSLGIEASNYIFYNRTSLNINLAFESFSEKEDYSHTVAIDSVGFYFKIFKGIGTYLYMIEPTDPDPSPYNSFDYTVTLIAQYLEKFYDERYQIAAHRYNDVYSLYLVSHLEKTFLITAGRNIEAAVADMSTAAPKEIFPKIKIVGFKSNSSLAFPSITKYVYRVQYVDGTYEVFSETSDAVVIPDSYPKSLDYDATENYLPADRRRLFKSNVQILLSINFEETQKWIPNARFIEVYAIRWIDNINNPIIENICKLNYTPFVNFLDGCTTYPHTITYDDFNAPLFVLNAAYSACAIKDNILYVGNQVALDASASGAKKADLTAWDPRIWQFNSQKKAAVINGQGDIVEYTMEEIISKDTTNWMYAQNNGIDCLDSELKRGTSSFAAFCNDATTYGAEGPNVWIQFIVGSMDYGNVYADKVGDPGIVGDNPEEAVLYNPLYNFSPCVNGISPASPQLGLPSEDLDGTWIGEDTIDGKKAHTQYNFYDDATPGLIAIKEVQFANSFDTSGHSFANPMFASRFKSLQHDSVYRLGCVLTYSDDTCSDVLFMGDVRTPSMNSEQYQLFEDHVRCMGSKAINYPTTDGNVYSVAQFVELRFFPLYLRVEFKNLDKIKGVFVKSIRVVYSIRDAVDKNVLTTGALHRTHSPIDPTTVGLTQQFWKHGQKHSLSPLPTLGISKYYFGGINCMCEPDMFNVSYIDRLLQNTQNLTSMAGADWLIHNSPDSIQIVRSYEYTPGMKDSDGYEKAPGSAVWNFYYASPVVINTTEDVSEKGYLFYAPEIDLLDIDGRPYIHSIGAYHTTANAFSLHYGLTSLMPAAASRDMIACLHSDANMEFTDFFDKKIAKAYKPTDPSFFDHKSTRYNYDGIYRSFDTWNNHNVSGKWGRNGCIMSTVITTAFTPLNDLPLRTGKDSQETNFSNEEYENDVSAFQKWWSNLVTPNSTKMVLDLVRKLRSPKEIIIANSNTVKTAKYVIKWVNYQKGSGNKKVLSTLRIKNQKNVKIKAQAFSELFQYLFPCSFSGHFLSAYPDGTPTYGVGVFSVPKIAFVNLCPLWSGACYPLTNGEGPIPTILDVNFFINQMSIMNRNHAFCSVHSTRAFYLDSHSAIPIYYGINDASVTPLSDHGQQMTPQVEKYYLVNDAVNAPGVTLLALTSSFRWHDSRVTYAGHEVPSKGALVFPDVLWDEFQKKRFKGKIHFTTEKKSAFKASDDLSNLSKYITPDGIPFVNDALKNTFKEYITKIDSEERSVSAVTSTYDYSCGLNYTGIGGSSLLFAAKDSTDFPGGVEFKISYNKSSAQKAKYLDDKVFLDDKATKTAEDHPNEADKLYDCLNNGTHVVLATLRNAVFPYSNTLEELTRWVETHSECILTPSETDNKTTGRQVVYGFDTFVGVHKRMYLNAIYPDGFGVVSDSAYSASTPVRMIFPYEGAINVDTANLTDVMDDPSNPGGGSRLKRIAPYTVGKGVTFKVNTMDYTPAKPDFSYNPVYSYNEINNSLVTKQNFLQKTDNIPERLRYCEFNFDTGRFNIFKEGQHLDFETKYGGITKIFPYGLELYVFQKNATSVVTPNARTLIPSKTDDRNIYLQANKLLGDGYRFVSNMYGASVGTDILATPHALYWVNLENRAILRHDGSGIVNIAAQSHVYSYIKKMLANRGDEVSCQIYKLRDSNVRFRFDESPYTETDYPFDVLGVDRRLIEYNEPLHLFSSFITLADFNVLKLNDRNIYLNDGMVFDEGTYDAWNYISHSDITPYIGVYINPDNSLDDKRFISCTIQDNDDICRDLIVDFSLEYNKEVVLERVLQAYHYRKILAKNLAPFLTRACDTPNIDGFTEALQGVNVGKLMEAVSLGKDLSTVPFTSSGRRVLYRILTGYISLGRGISFGRKISFTFDIIDEFEKMQSIKHIGPDLTAYGGGGVISKGITLHLSFQSFNAFSRDEAGRTPEINAKGSFGSKYNDLKRRARFYFLPVKINFESNV